MFFLSGFGKATQSWETLQVAIPWIDGVSEGLLRFIGWSEVLGGIGMILPAAIKVKPMLSAISAAALTLVMVLATGFHAMRTEYDLMFLTLVLALLSGFVAYGRCVLKPINSTTPVAGM
jgi:uncharacterized membrane protein YphA (DoxX/SURF4 family)